MRDSLKQALLHWGLWLVALLLAAAAVAPGPSWIYLSAAGLVTVILLLVDLRFGRSVLSLLASIFPTIDRVLSGERRRLEVLQRARGLNRTLEFFKQNPVAEDALQSISGAPPPESKDDLAVCCKAFETKIYGEKYPVPMAAVLEILYRDFHGEPNPALWKDVSPEQKRELANILVKSERLPELESGDRMMDLVGWVLDRLPNFSLKTVEAELELFYQLWLHLSGYAGYLRSSGIPASPSVDGLRNSIDRDLRASEKLSSAYDRVATSVLVAFGSEEICAWARSTNVPAGDAKNLAIISIGTFSSSSVVAAIGKSSLKALGRQVIAFGALDILVAFLWTRSKTGFTPDVCDLAHRWKTWRDEAQRGIGNDAKGMGVMYEVLKGDLLKGSWPILLPIERTMSEVVKQNQDIRDMLNTLLKAPREDWSQQVDELLALARREAKVVPSPDPTLEETVKSAVKEMLLELSPTRPADLEEFVTQFRTETREVNHPNEQAFERLTFFRERVVELGHKLEELSDLLVSEAGGARAYLITFDQSRGGLANVIDDLKKRHGFEFVHYTRYSRIGVLRPGQTFEAFYRDFTEKLEKRLLEATADRSKAEPPEEWENIEITVQQISLPHRHDFLPRGTILTKVFRVPPANALLLSAA